jgi:predicted kinase
MTEMVIMVGLPLSGKSTIAGVMAKGKYYNSTQSWGPHYTIVCPDDVRMALYNQEFYGPTEPMTWGIIDVMARSLLLRGQSIIVDATNLTEWERDNWIRLAERMDVDWEVCHIPTSKEECIQRAKDDRRDYMIPVIERLAKKFEPITRKRPNDSTGKDRNTA